MPITNSDIWIQQPHNGWILHTQKNRYGPFHFVSWMQLSMYNISLFPQSFWFSVCTFNTCIHYQLHYLRYTHAIHTYPVSNLKQLLNYFTSMLISQQIETFHSISHRTLHFHLRAKAYIGKFPESEFNPSTDIQITKLHSLPDPRVLSLPSKSFTLHTFSYHPQCLVCHVTLINIIKPYSTLGNYKEDLYTSVFSHYRPIMELFCFIV